MYYAWDLVVKGSAEAEARVAKRSGIGIGAVRVWTRMPRSNCLFILRCNTAARSYDDVWLEGVIGG
jgi:hypothetical protein